VTEGASQQQFTQMVGAVAQRDAITPLFCVGSPAALRPRPPTALSGTLGRLRSNSASAWGADFGSATSGAVCPKRTLHAAGEQVEGKTVAGRFFGMTDL
jgi:hypothetical protein